MINAGAESPWQMAILAISELKTRKIFKSRETVEKERSDITIPENIQVLTGCGTPCSGLVSTVVGVQKLDSMILEVSSNTNSSMILLN